MLMALGAGASLLGGLYGMYKGQDALKNAYNPYDIAALRKEQGAANQLYKDIAGYGRQAMGYGQEMYGQGQSLMDQGQSFFDIGSEHNQLMRKSIMGDAMSQVALQNTLAQRNPNQQGSGIAQQNLRASQLQGTKQSQDAFLQGYRQNMGIGQGLLGQGLQSQQAGMSTYQSGVGNIGASAQGQAGLAENIQQAMIANNEMRNQQARDQSAYWNQMGSSMFGLGGTMLGML
jgi:hypothetical protein